MPAAIAIPAIIGAAGVGTQLFGAKKASDAAKSAAQLQIDATNKAQAFNQQAYNDQKGYMQPYMQAGQQSLGALMARQQTPLAQRSNSFIQSAQHPQMAPPPGGMPGGGMSLGQAMQPPQGQPVADGPPSSTSGGGMVRVQAPTGEIAQFAEGSPGLQQALSKGAVRVS